MAPALGQEELALSGSTGAVLPGWPFFTADSDFSTPALADLYQRLMVQRRHNHISANTAVARKLVCRAWAVLQTGQPYQPRDLDGNPIDAATATAMAAALAVPDEVRRRAGPTSSGDA